MATPTPCATPAVDRFTRPATVPDPPAGPIGRRRFWDDTVFEAIGELRRGLGSSRESLYVMALLTIVELEKHKMRHGRPISGTTVPNVSEDDDTHDPLPKLAPLDEDRPKRHTAAPPAPQMMNTDVPITQVSIQKAVVVGSPPTHGPGSHGGPMAAPPAPLAACSPRPPDTGMDRVASPDPNPSRPGIIPRRTDPTPEGSAVTADSQAIDRVVELMRASKSILFITGAGMSADSGLPTYRGIGGLYDGRDPEENVPIEVLLSGEVFDRRPELTWKYLLQVGRAGRAARPNRGHEILADIESRFERVWILTQNVDGFHQQAGSKNVIDIHGDVRKVRCVRCSFRGPAEDYPDTALPPRCGQCNGVLRPEVVLFGEPLPPRQLATYQAETRRGFDLVFSIGTTSVFPYIAGPVLDAHHHRRPSVEINPGETDVSEFATVRLRLRAAEALDAVWSRFTATG